MPHCAIYTLGHPIFRHLRVPFQPIERMNLPRIFENSYALHDDCDTDDCADVLSRYVSV